MLGSVITGTLRPQELLPRFLDTLNTVMPAAYDQLMMLPFGYIPSSALEDDDDEWWSSEECSARVDELIEALNEYAPENTWFGAHPGDGADFGFWPVEEDDASAQD